MRYLWIVIVWVAALVGALTLALRSGEKYSPDNAEREGATFGDRIGEAHGPITAFLWVCYAAAVIFTAVYSYAHWADIAAMFMMKPM